MIYYHETFSSPFGDFSVAVDEEGSVVATAFGDLNDLKDRLTIDEAADTFRTDATRTKQACTQLREYFSGKRSEFDLPLKPAGTKHQQRVWAELLKIPTGKTKSYGEIAKKIGSSPRAVGRANATNPICVIIPCHRVIGADGSLTGFAFGEDAKQRLLALEGVQFAEQGMLQMD